MSASAFAGLLAVAVAWPAAAQTPFTVNITCADGSTGTITFDHEPTKEEVDQEAHGFCGTTPETSAPEGSTKGVCPKAVKYTSSKPLTYSDGTPVGKTLLVRRLVKVPAAAKLVIKHNGVTWTATSKSAWQYDSACYGPGKLAFVPYLRGASGYKVSAPAKAAKYARTASDEALIHYEGRAKLSYTYTRKGNASTLAVAKGGPTVTISPNANFPGAVCKPGRAVRISKAGVKPV